MAERDKIEPFWARPMRGKRRTGPALIVPERDAPASAEPDDKSSAADAPRAREPHEPSFAVAREERREAIAAIISGHMASPAPAPPVLAPGAERDPLAGPTFGREPPAAAGAPAADGWVHLSAAEAARHPLYGVHGWLVVIAIFIALGLLRALVEIVDFWATTDHGGLAAWIMAVLRSVMALWAALLLGLLLGRSRAFPTNLVAYAMVNIVYLGLFGLAFAHVTRDVVFAGVGVGIAMSLLTIAYVLRSRRVNVTFRHRLRPKKSKPPKDDAAPPEPAERALASGRSAG